MDYSLLLGVHYRAPQHLRSLMSYNRSIGADGLGILAEEGGFHIQYLMFCLFDSYGHAKVNKRNSRNVNNSS